MASVISVYRALANVSREPLYRALVHEALEISVCGSLRRPENVYYLLCAYAAVFLFQVIEYRLFLASFISVFSVDLYQLLAVLNAENETRFQIQV